MTELFALLFRAEAQSIYAWVICGAALIWGGGPERVIAGVWLFLFKFVDEIYHAVFERAYQLVSVDVAHAAIDSAAAFAWVFVALYANRNYPLFIAAMQLLAVTAHVARGIAEPISPIAYAAMAFAPAYFQLIILTAGLARHIVRKRKHGAYRDWRVPRGWTSKPTATSFRGRVVAVLGYDFFARKDQR